MTFTSLRAALLTAVLAFPLIGCAGSPDPVFYALSAQSGARLQGPALRIEMRNAGLPGYLDRPHIVRRASAERLELAADERWGAPLDTMVSATLSDDLGQRLPNCIVFGESGSISTLADVRVEVQFSRFELAADGSVHVEASSAVRWTSGTEAVRLKRHTFTVQPASKSTPDLVSSLSSALGELADAIALTIQQGPPPPAPSSEPSAPLAP